MKNIDRAHLHVYDQDARDGRASFVVCSICGFSAPKYLVLQSSLVLARQLSAALLVERAKPTVLVVAADAAGNPKKILREVVGDSVVVEGGAR
jgi:hypothetical protein